MKQEIELVHQNPLQILATCGLAALGEQLQRSTTLVLVRRPSQELPVQRIHELAIIRTGPEQACQIAARGRLGLLLDEVGVHHQRRLDDGASARGFVELPVGLAEGFGEELQVLLELRSERHAASQVGRAASLD